MDEDNKIIEQLILKGAVEFAGVSDTGEPLYNFTQNLKEVMPELYREHLNFVNAALMGLWEKGFIDMNLLEDSPIVRLSLKAFDEKEISTLSDQDQFSLKEIKRILTQ
ncbi:MAG: hypothetical protein EBW15_09075 [Actinobacteria bacterium]|nr:hypothetical protein [Actinomycetota bacterium]